MGILDFDDYEEDSENEQQKRERLDEELGKYKDMLKDGPTSISSIEALEEIVNYYFEHEKYEEALHFISRLLEFTPYSTDTCQAGTSFPSKRSVSL